jgi:hypothetical protein
VNHLCPVCNGLAGLYAGCPDCGRSMEDTGRLYDYYGDYSPYMPIDESKLSNGLPDREQHLCVHVAWCPSCRQEQRLAIPEWTDADLQTGLFS